MAIRTHERGSGLSEGANVPNEAADDTGTDRRARTTVPLISVVIPTKDEAENIQPLIERMEQLGIGPPLEVIVVDDSEDATPDVVEALRERSALQITLLHRERGDRSGGLGGAVLAGMQRARAPWVCVMDADLQHPPEVIHLLIDRVREADVDLVVASRKASDGSNHGLSRWRRAVSDGCTLLARTLFRTGVGRVRDPMSGFFMVRREAIDLGAMRPRGFKILLELLVRHPALRCTEVPYEFGTRLAGESKASAREGLDYLLLVGRLWLQGSARRLRRLGVSGAGGG